MQNPSTVHPYAISYDLSNCHKEPIQFIRLIQSHGCLLVCDPTSLEIVHLSKNTLDFFGFEWESLLNQPLSKLFSAEVLEVIKSNLSDKTIKSVNPLRVELPNNQGAWHNLLVHLQDELLYIEIEPEGDALHSSGYFYKVEKALARIHARLNNRDQLYDTITHEIKLLTGYDRVMLYQFDQEYNGSVVAEAKEAHLESFLGLHYPASDIPPQARALYLINRTRIISDVNDTPVEIYPAIRQSDGQPLNLTHCTARGISNLHIEYLKNMGVGATLSIAIIVEDNLWGLIACHHYQPKFLDFSMRTICQFIGQTLSSHIGAKQTNDLKHNILQVNIIKRQLLDQLREEQDIIAALIHSSVNLLSLTSACGVAIVVDNQIHTLGQTPSDTAIRQLIAWLDDTQKTFPFSTDRLALVYSEAKSFKAEGAGVLVIKIAEDASDFIVWFKPEQVQLVTWAGKPEKVVAQEGSNIRLSPRKSFEQWQQRVEDTSEPWQPYELEIAALFQEDIQKNLILQKYHQISELHQRLQEAYDELESFSYSVSHDLRAPLRSIEGFAEILKEDFDDSLEEKAKQILSVITESTARMNLFIDGILSYSKLGRSDLRVNELDMDSLIKRIVEELLKLEPKGRKINLRIIEPLPKVFADQLMMWQIFQNLLSNALKYTSKELQAEIEIGGKKTDHSTLLYVKDNGIGFDITYHDKIFGVFKRLVDEQDYPGTGVGLAIVNRAVQRHGGKIWAESKVGVGTCFFLELPIVHQI